MCFLSMLLSQYIGSKMPDDDQFTNQKSENSGLVQCPMVLEWEAKSQIPFHCPGIRLIFFSGSCLIQNKCTSELLFENSGYLIMPKCFHCSCFFFHYIEY